MYMYGPRLNPPPTPPRVTRSSFPELTYQPQSQRLQKEDSPASADLRNLVEWRTAYRPIAERNIQRAKPILRTPKGTWNKHYKAK